MIRSLTTSSRLFSQAYNWLRKSANLILNLLNLMVDAGIAELSTDPAATLAKVEEKFRCVS
jgi:phosphatidylinositol 3-kinase